MNNSHGARNGLAEPTAAIDKTEAYLRAKGYRGYDPYDCLTSPIFQLPMLRTSRVVRLACQQALRRLPIQIRPLLGIKSGLNVVTLAFVLQGLAYRMRSGRTDSSHAVSPLVSHLRRLVTPGYRGACWGYDFDWQSRYGTIPARHPTIVATGFVTNALYELYRLHGDSQARDLVINSIGFLVEDMNRTERDDGICWSYSPDDVQQVLNASMMGARLCAQAYSISHDRSLLELATRAVRFVVAEQRADGSWPYSVSDRRSWTDNFHTGYILDCLDEYERLTGDSQFVEAKDRGVRFYIEHFLTPEGAAAYYHDRVHPLDSNATGQALLTLCRFSEVQRAERLARWSIEHLALADGAWKYRIYRYGENRLVYMRWSVASMYLGLSRLELAKGTGATNT